MRSRNLLILAAVLLGLQLPLTLALLFGYFGWLGDNAVWIVVVCALLSLGALVLALLWRSNFLTAQVVLTVLTWLPPVLFIYLLLRFNLRQND